MGLEGIVSKRLTAPYRSEPSRDWIKVKNPDSPAMQQARERQWQWPPIWNTRASVSADLSDGPCPPNPPLPDCRLTPPIQLVPALQLGQPSL
jgi:hypothetical protein